MSINIENGDIVYFYETSLYKQIVLKAKVVSNKILEKNFLNGKKYDINNDSSWRNPNCQFIRCKLIEFINGDLNRKFIKSIGILNRSYKQSITNNQTQLIENKIVKRGANLFHVYGKNAPSTYYLKNRYSFIGLDGNKYFTILAKYSPNDKNVNLHICKENKSLVEKGHQKRILEDKLKSLNQDIYIWNKSKNKKEKMTTHQMIRRLERTLKFDDKNQEILNENIQLNLTDLEYKKLAEKKYTPEEVNKKHICTISQLIRSAKNKEEAKAKANFICEFNKNHITFLNKKKRSYIEVHHLIPLCHQDDDNGKRFPNSLDNAANLICLCPTCHRKIHYGIDKSEMLKFLYYKRKNILEQAGICISLDELLKFYK